MKTYYKAVGRTFKKNFSRFISIIFIVMISVSLTSGVGSSGSKLKNSLNDFAIDRNVSDIIVKSKTQSGFTDDAVLALKNEYGEENVSVGSSFDAYITVNGERRLTRLYFSDDITSRTVNKFMAESERAAEAEEGTFPAYAESADNNIKGYSVGDVISLDFKDIFTQLAEQDGRELGDFQKQIFDLLEPVKITITKIAADPLVFAKEGEPSYLNGNAEIPDVLSSGDLINLDDILYLPSAAMPVMAANGDIYVSLAEKTDKKLFSSDYNQTVETEKKRITELLASVGGKTVAETEEQIAFITLDDNFSFKSVNAYAGKITALAVVLMVAFALITALVVLSNMTRLMDEERAQTACLSTLGYSFGKIIAKYLAFALAATAIGGFAAYFIGTGLCSFIYLVFGYSYVMPPESGVFEVVFFVITLSFIVLSAVGATISSGMKTAKETPAELLKPRAPKPGRKVIIEKIPFIWNRLSFRYKSTARNVLRYFDRFIMTVVAVAGSMGLVMAGLALLDMCLFGDFGNASIAWLAVVVVAFAALLTLTAVYTITDISISERKREIATLMVLGYYDIEVSGYIYREIYIDSAVGIIFGYGAGAILMYTVFKVMGFGSLGAVSWYVWLIAPALVWLFTFAVTLILRKRIVSVDMNASLKAVE